LKILSKEGLFLLISNMIVTNNPENPIFPGVCIYAVIKKRG